jgi:nitroreductase
MDCIELVLSRKSVRKFKDEPVSERVMNNILEAGRLAPSAMNRQPWHFVVATGQKEKEACSIGRINSFVTGASFVIVGLFKEPEAFIERLALMDVTIALQNMVVAAWVQGVGSCWLGGFDGRKLKDALNLPADSFVVGGVAFGIPDEDPKQPTKKPLSEMVHFDKW